MSRRRHSLLLVLGLLACTHAPGPPPPAEDSGAVAFVGVTVVPMDAERRLPDQTVLIRQGRIAEVGPSSTVEVPAGALRIDGRGRFLMPGLADMHVHLWTRDDLLLFLANGVTFVRNMWGSPQDLVWRARIERGELLGPTVYTAGPLLDGAPPIWNGSAVVESAADAARVVAAQKKAGYDFIKVYKKLSREAYDAIAAEAKREGMTFGGHVPAAVDLPHALAAGQRSVEHLDGYFEYLLAEGSSLRGKADLPSRLRMVDELDDRKVPQAAELTRRAGAWNCVTLVVLQRFVPKAEAEALLRRPEMRFVPPSTKALWDPDKDFRLKTLTAANFAQLRKGDQVRLRLTKALHDAGARLLLGTDTPNPFVAPGFSIHDELASLVKAGLSPYEALRAGTRDAAEFVGQSKELGTVAPGMRADLLLLEADPLLDVANAARRSGVMVRGRWLPQAELERRLEEMVARWSAPKRRFQDAAALPGSGEQLFSGRYELFYGDVSAGEERLAIQRLPGGRRVIHSQESLDAQEANNALRIELDATGTPETLRYDIHSGLGTGALEVSRREKGLHVSGQAPAGAQVALDREEAPDALLGVSMIAPYVVVAERLRPLGAGKSVTLKGRKLTLDPDVELAPETLTVERQADDRETVAGRSVDVRRYRLKIQHKNGSYNGSLSVDAAGYPVTLEIENNMGIIRYRRIE